MIDYYLDHTAATPLDRNAISAITAFTLLYGNPSSAHTYGREMRSAIETAREKIAKTIGASSSEIIFTSGATEGNKSVLNTFSGEREISFSTRTEHDSLLKNVDVSCIPTGKDGSINPSRVFGQVTSYKGIGYDKVLFATSIVNNEIGTVQNIKQLAGEVHHAGGYILADASAAIDHVHIDVKDMDVDYLTASGEKFGALSGTGFIYVKNGNPFVPLLRGSQENGRRGGTENVIGILTMAAAIHNPTEKDICDRATRYLTFEHALESKLHEHSIPYRINSSSPTAQMSGILNISFKDLESDALLFMLEKNGVLASAGSACNSGVKEISHVLKAIEVPEEFAKGTVRFSLGNYDRLDVTDVTNRIIESVRELKNV